MLSRVVRSPIIWRVSGSSRCQSTALAGDLVTIDVNEKNGISTLRMNHEPVNSMTLNFLKEFSEKMDQLEKNRVKGMILTSVSEYSEVQKVQLSIGLNQLCHDVIYERALVIKIFNQRNLLFSGR